MAGTTASFMLDTGAAVTLRREDRWKVTKNAEAKLEVWQDPNLVGADGTQIAVLGQVKTDVLMAGETFVQSMVIVKALATEGILGMDFLKDNECTISTHTYCCADTHSPTHKSVLGNTYVATGRGGLSTIASNGS